MPLHLDLQHREAVLLVEVSHAFDQPREAFGIRSARGDRRIHCKRFDAAQPRRTASGFADRCPEGLLEDVRDPAVEPLHQAFQRLQGDVLLAHLHAVKGRGGDAGLPAELRIAEVASPGAEITGQLLLEGRRHEPNAVAKTFPHVGNVVDREWGPEIILQSHSSGLQNWSKSMNSNFSQEPNPEPSMEQAKDDKAQPGRFRRFLTGLPTAIKQWLVELRGCIVYWSLQLANVAKRRWLSWIVLPREAMRLGRLVIGSSDPWSSVERERTAWKATESLLRSGLVPPVETDARLKSLPLNILGKGANLAGRLLSRIAAPAVAFRIGVKAVTLQPEMGACRQFRLIERQIEGQRAEFLSRSKTSGSANRSNLVWKLILPTCMCLGFGWVLFSDGTARNFRTFIQRTSKMVMNWSPTTTLSTQRSDSSPVSKHMEAATIRERNETSESMANPGSPSKVTEPGLPVASSIREQLHSRPVVWGVLGSPEILTQVMNDLGYAGPSAKDLSYQALVYRSAEKAVRIQVVWDGANARAKGVNIELEVSAGLPVAVASMRTVLLDLAAQVIDSRDAVDHFNSILTGLYVSASAGQGVNTFGSDPAFQWFSEKKASIGETEIRLTASRQDLATKGVINAGLTGYIGIEIWR